MKNLRSLIIFLAFPLFGLTQSLNGVYTGVLYNDSTTVRKDQSFELALTEYKGKVYGYAYSTFIVNDTLYYIVKRVKGTVDGDICEVEDDEVISHNFPQKPDKKVFVTYILRKNRNDSIWEWNGEWKTNPTKKYYAITGKVETKEEKDLAKSKLYEHLGDLNLQQTLAFEKPKEITPEKKPVKDKKSDIAKNTKTSGKKESDPDQKKAADKDDSKIKSAVIAKIDTKPAEDKSTSLPVNNALLKNEKKEVVTNNNNTEKKTDPVLAKAESKIPENKTASLPVNNAIIQNEKKEVVINNNKGKKNDPVVAKTETKQPEKKSTPNPPSYSYSQNENKNVTANNNLEKKIDPLVVKTETKQPEKKLTSNPPSYSYTQNENKNVTTNNNTEKKNDPFVTKTETKIPENKTISNPTKNIISDPNESTKKQDDGFVFTELRSSRRKLKPASALVDGRISTPSETIYFTSDSLSIALYDNGEVDGDTVSVIINDVIFIEKQGLKSSAFRKTFYIPEDESDSLLVVLYAENLGKYPPNTGLLQIKDGEEIFYVRFKADLDRNAAIVLRRKYK